MSYKNKKLLAVIPARGGSKGIPRKNLKLLNGKPLIDYILEKLISVGIFDKVIVSSDCDKILSHCKKFKKVNCLKRPNDLSGDLVTLDPVIFHSYQSCDGLFDYIFTFQPTSPLLTEETIKESVKRIIDGNCDSLMTVIDDRHLNWILKEGKFVPSYIERVNRQKLPVSFKETGSIIACSKEVISINNRLSDNINLLEISKKEGIDIDSYSDWIIAEEMLKEPKICFLVIGNQNKGLGHVYRSLTLADQLKYKPLFLIKDSEDLAIKHISDSFYEIKTFNSQDDLDHLLKSHQVDLIINDTLDTSEEEILFLKGDSRFVVSFEDLGVGADYADLVFNALYEGSFTNNNSFFGYKFVCLRDEFSSVGFKKIKDNVKNVLVTFGGTDPNNITDFVVDLIKSYNLEIEVIVGIGYSKLDDLISKYSSFDNIKIIHNVEKMSEHIINSDIVITSNGRTVYEVVSLGVPLITIAQNERELKHTFGEISKTAIHLGLFSGGAGDNFINEFDNLINNFKLRRTINSRMKRLDLINNTSNVIKIILDQFYRFKKNV